MRMKLRCVAILGLLLSCSSAMGQIYRCTAADGTPIFSDERCGPDAKVVPGIGTGKRSSSPVPKAEKPAPKSASELQELLARCDQGDTKACTAWTMAGGTRQLREQEQKQEAACEAGSLAACEQRYCQDGLSEECRRRVLQVAKLSGTSWYLREQQTVQDGSTRYAVACMQEGSRELREFVISCAALAGPSRCTIAAQPQKYARLDQAAAGVCARRQ